MQTEELEVAHILDVIARHAAAADRSRSLATDVVSAVRANDIMRFSATAELGGLNASIVRIARELEAVSGACASTAWVLWNHLCTFHLFAGLLGPDNAGWLRRIVESHGWVCFPAGASTGVSGSRDGDTVRLTGKAAFGSGARYADFAGVSFMPEGEQTPAFCLVELDQPGVNIDPDWVAMSLRASATDTVHYDGARIDADRVVDFPFMYRVAFRDPDRKMISPRYREDWVGLSDIWLGAMATGLVQAALDELTGGVKDRIAIMGVKVAERPSVHLNLGQAQVYLNAARSTIYTACHVTDERIESAITPGESDYLDQLGAAVAALQLCSQALQLLQRVNGGNGLREGPEFERRVRDVQAMPLHINAHQDRVNEQIGRHLLGLPGDNPF